MLKQSMNTGHCVCLFLLLTVSVILAQGRGFGYGHHCRNYPFAPRCLGVAAKRSLEYDFNNRVSSDIINRAAPYDMYSTLIKRVLDEAKRQKPTISTGDDPNRLYDENSLFDKLASLIDKPQTDLFDTNAYSDGSDNWNTRFNDNDRRI